MKGRVGSKKLAPGLKKKQIKIGFPEVEIHERGGEEAVKIALKEAFYLMKNLRLYSPMKKNETDLDHKERLEYYMPPQSNADTIL